MYNFDPYNVLLSIATNIPVLLMTAFVLQGHISVKKSMQRIYFLRRLRSFGARKQILLLFFMSVIMIVLQYCNSMVYEFICQFKNKADELTKNVCVSHFKKYMNYPIIKILIILFLN